MVLWTFRCYDDGGVPNLWQRWYTAEPDYNGTHDSVFRILETQLQWTNTIYTVVLPGGILEVRLSGARQWRVLGYYGSARREFVVTAIGYHKGKVYTPKDLLKQAVSRRVELENGTRNAPICERPS